MDDDLNVPRAVGALFTFVRTANRLLDTGAWGPIEAGRALEAFDRVMAVLDLLPSVRDVDDELRAWVEAKIEARAAARRARDFAAADAIREEVAARGIELEDTPQGTRWRRRGG